jgi:two-component system, cell cycle response regulator DivK
MSKRILVVEDTEDNRQIIRDLLSSVGYELIEAMDGAEGVAMAQNEHPDLILMDIQLPQMDGYEATRRIRAIPELAQVPIIAVTSYALSPIAGQGPRIPPRLNRKALSQRSPRKREGRKGDGGANRSQRNRRRTEGAFDSRTGVARKRL